jgi:tRNA pseudouridine38-40 synthase
VHARAQVANFKIDKLLTPAEIKKALNSILPKDIRVRSAERVSLNFHARYSVKSKIYRYNIFTGEYISPFKVRYFWHLPLDLDYPKIDRELNQLIGRHDFKNFQAQGSTVKSTQRTVLKAFSKRKGNYCSIFIEADGFLYKMVRLIVGTLVDVGRDRFKSGRIKSLLDGDKVKRGSTAPAEGLFLWQVKY